MVILFNIPRKAPNCFPKWLLYEGSNFSKILKTFITAFLFIAFLVDLKWYFIVALICTSLMTTDVIFHVLISCLYTFFGEISNQVFCPIFSPLAIF